METLVKARGLTKNYNGKAVVDHVDLDISRGRIVGLIGHNGAGKTTLLKCLLGLTPSEGELEVMGFNPHKQRARLMNEACFIADTALLPKWINARQAIEYLKTVHPKFNPQTARDFLAKTDVEETKPVRALSKGMTAQLHLALVMSIDVPLLVLDEPTLGLDILYRKQFYNSLLNDYFDQNRTIIITTHQVEEIETLLTDLVFMKHGKIVLNTPMEDIENRYLQVSVAPEKVDAARALKPVFEETGLGKTKFIFEDSSVVEVQALGDVGLPSIANLFVAKMQ